MKYNKEFNNIKLIEGNDDYDKKYPTIHNVGWSLGNSCPYSCKHCYSKIIRNSNLFITKDMIDKIILQLSKLDVKTVNLGGNEPWFTNGLNDESLLPYIIEKLYNVGYKVGITTSGISLIKLFENNKDIIRLINDIDISLDSADELQHNYNRGANVYKDAIRALELANNLKINHSIIMCAMKWNFNIENIEKICDLAYKYNSNIRINILKPLEKKHNDEIPKINQLFEGYIYLLNRCEVIDSSEPKISSLIKSEKEYGCSCGKDSFRIHSINEDGTIPISPCIYLHDFKVGNILKDDILDILDSKSFSEFRKREKYYRNILDCRDCKKINLCKGGCAAQAYLHNYWENGEKSLNTKEPNCYYDYFKDEGNDIEYKISDKSEKNLVHMNYLCTFIGKVKN